MSRPHITLRPGFNLFLVAAWGIATLLLTLYAYPRPLPMVLAAGVLGVICGLMQQAALQEKPHGFLHARSMIEVQRQFTKTRWGQRYRYFLWASYGAIMMVSFILLRNFGAMFAGYFSLMFAREAVTLRATYSLAQAKRTKGTLA